MACPTSSIVRACDFPQFWVQQTPVFDELIIEDIRPTDGWMGNIAVGTVEPGTPAEITQDRFRSVWPNVTRPWVRVPDVGVGCTGNPCDPPENCIGVGAERITYYAEQQTWVTDLFCYDQDWHITHAREHVRQLVEKILRPATSAIFSNFARKSVLRLAGNHIVANATMSTFTFEWILDGSGNEAFLQTNIAPTGIFKLSPQLLQRRWQYQMLNGYAGQNPFKETAPYVELVSDMDTVWELDKLGGSTGVGGTPSVAGNWRFTQWDAANAYWRYGFSGQIGNFMVRVDPFSLRFNYVGVNGAGLVNPANVHRYQVVLPYQNNVTSGAGGAAGIGADVNQDYLDAQYRISFIHHKRGIEMQVASGGQIDPERPFMHRDFGGRWQWQMHDLGADQAGTVIKNAWGNKGRFGAWFKYYARPLHTEFLEAIIHKGEPQCVPEINTCNSDPGYATQSYDSCNTDCAD